MILVIFNAASASAEGESSYGPPLPSSDEVIQAIEAGESRSVPLHPTDPGAAEELPHEDLGRSEAANLLQSVFSVQLQAPAGIFDELEVARFLAPDVALLPSDDPPELVAATQPVPSKSETSEQDSAAGSEKEALRDQSPFGGESDTPIAPQAESPGRLQGGTLLDSSIPLRTESPSGGMETVDLSLQHEGGEIQPAAPLAEVGIPSEIGEGIELPETGVTIELAQAPDERATSLVDQSVAFVPNVADDTDLAIAPTPTGVETLTQLRTPDAPLSQTFNLDLPPGAILAATEDGGATVKEGEDLLVSISAPTAIDAAGDNVPVSLEVAGDSLTLITTPDASTAFPVLVDPLFQTYEWATATYYKSGICNSSFKTETSTSCMNREEWGYEESETVYHSPPHFRLSNRNYGSGTPGLFIETNQDLGAGSKGSMIYTVPRYFSDYAKYGTRPTSFISKMTLWNLNWHALSSYLSPYLFAGLWDPVKPGWVSYYSHEGLNGHSVTDMSWQYNFLNSQPNTNVKIGYLSIQATETKPNQNTDVYVGSSKLELSDNGIPGFGSLSGPSQWVNQTALPIAFTASDSGLGMYAITLSEATAGTDYPPSYAWKTTYGCIGVSGAACPRTWGSSDVGPPALKYEPALMPQGVDYLNAVAEDPVGNKSAAGAVQIKVDHTAPGIALAGTMTEQATLGTKRPTYTLKAETTDGTVEQPQSGVANVSIEFDGKVVSKTEPGCATKNCAIPIEMSIESSKFSAGQHTVKVNATDAVGLTTTKTLTIELQPSPPSIALSGTMTEQATLGASRPRYKLKLNASAEAGIEGLPTTPTFSSSFGSSGAGDGQFVHPGDVALDSKGSLWVVDENNNRIEKFNEKGEFISKFGAAGSSNGQFSRPTSLAIDAKGNIWVTDAGNNRIEQFNEKGEFLKAVGTYGASNGQFSGPEGIAIDAKGNIWVSDTYNARLQKLNEKGEFIKVVGTRGSATGQLVEPTGIDIGPGGNVWVTDWANNRVEVYNEVGEYVRQFGSEGTGNAQFRRPDALAIDTKGNVWVGDQNNNRVQQFNQSGEYVAQFGSVGSGNGQFSFGYPMGIAVDSKGNLWATDTGNNRVQKWLIPGYAPAYSSSFGSSGTAGGQFNHPAGIAISKGFAWVVDENNNRIEKFNEKGEYLSSFGSSGSGNGQFSRPTSAAIDPKGNIWVTDAGNSRIEQFNEKGEFLKAVGSSGSGNGQFNGAEGIAIDSKGNIWVADTYNGRLQKFNEKGEFIKVASTKGSGTGQLGEPTGLDTAPDGSVWVADWQNNRVAVFSEAGAFVRQFGSEGTGNSQFKRPDVIDVDTKGNVWVGDQNNARIQEFNQSGEYITQFGSAGSGQGQFSFGYPMGITSDTKGNIWIADTGNNRVQRWTLANWRSEITTEITIDGKQVDFGQAGCISEKCPAVREWILDSSAYSVGKHTVVAKGTDGLGNTASKALTIEVQRDTTKPALQVSGELAEAPEGWVEQESYSLNASASDTGFGVTSLALKIDSAQVTSTSQACLDGGCSGTLAKQIDMSAYSGGAHTADLVATDGAGNVTTQHWTINVDPEGHITASEAEETLDAVDATSETAVVAPTDDVLEPEQMEGGDNPGLQQTGSEITSTGVPDTTTMTTDPEDGFTIHSPGGETQITPAVDGSSSSTIIAEDVAGVAANTTSEVDSVIRPEYNGAQTFQAIRSTSSPDSFSWTVKLTEEQELHLVNPAQAEVLYKDGTRSFLITAGQAHDAIGTTVPTSLSVAGNVLTLKVDHHSASFVYPVVAGQGWEGGYEAPVIVIGPEDDIQIREREEREAAEGGEEAAPPPPPGGHFSVSEAEHAITAGAVGEIIPAPAPSGGSGASASSVQVKTVKPLKVCQSDSCGMWHVELKNPSYFYKVNSNNHLTAWWEPGTQVHSSWYYPWYYTPELNVEGNGCGFVGPGQVWSGEHKHLAIWGRYTITATGFTPTGETIAKINYLALQIWVWPNGYQQRVVKHWTPSMPIEEA